MAVRTKQELRDELIRLILDNTSGDISPADVRSVFGDLIDSTALTADLPTGQAGATPEQARQIGENTSRISHLERRGGGSLNLYHLGAGSEQYTQAEFVALAGQNLTITGHIDDPELLPDGLFFLLITNGDGSHTVKTQNASSTAELEVFQLGTTKRTARNQLSAGEVKFTFQITTAEMNALFIDSSRQPIESAFVEFQVGLGPGVENNVLASYFENLVGTGLTADQALAISRAGQGVLLARQEAREADGKATVAQEQNAGQDTRLEVIEDDGWVTDVRLAQEVKDQFITAEQAAAITANSDAIAALPPVTIADPIIEPAYWVDDNEARTVAVHFDDAALALTGAAKVRLTIQGNSVTVNIAADQHTYEFAYNATASTNISNARRVGQTVRADTFVLDSSDNQLYHVIGLLRVVAEAPGSGGGGGGWTEVTRISARVQVDAESNAARNWTRLATISLPAPESGVVDTYEIVFSAQVSTDISGGNRRYVLLSLGSSTQIRSNSSAFISPRNLNINFSSSVTPTQGTYISENYYSVQNFARITDATTIYCIGIAKGARDFVTGLRIWYRKVE